MISVNKEMLFNINLLILYSNRSMKVRDEDTGWELAECVAQMAVTESRQANEVSM